ncbi:MAG: hypothetical protein ABI467_01650 [Kofleriaceae bacterium]
MASPGTAFLAAYLPWRRMAHDERVALVDRNAATVDPQLRHAIEFLRKGLAIEEKLVAETDARLAALPKAEPAAPAEQAAARAGAIARDAAVAVAVAAHLAYLRCSAPDNPDLREQAHARAQQLKEQADRLASALEATGLPSVKPEAHRVAEIVARVRDLEPTTDAGYRQLNDLVRDVTAGCDEIARHLDKAAVAAPAPAPAPAPASGGPVTEVTLDADGLLTALPATATRVKVRKAQGRIAEIVRSPVLATLEALNLDNQGVTDDDLIALAASPHVAHLRRLDLRYNPISARGIEAIAGSPNLNHLEAVYLDGNPADPVDRLEYYDETHTHRVPTAAGKALEAKYGPLRWLHPS